MANPFLAGQRLTAGQLNDATEKTLKSIEMGQAGTLAVTAGTTELNVPKLALGPAALVNGGLYHWDVRMTLQMSVGTDEFDMIIRRNTALTGPVVSDWVIYRSNNTAGFLFVTWDDFPSAALDPAVNYFTSFQRLSGTGTLTVFGQLSGTNRSGEALRRTGYSSEYALVP